MRRMGQMFHLEVVDMDSESIKRSDFERLEHLITKTIDQRLTGIDQRLTEAIDKKPRFDWKWFLGLTVPIVSAILAAAVIGYFGIRADLRVMQSQFGEMQKSIVQIRQTQNEHTRAISNLQGDIKTLEGDIKVIKYALKIKQ